MKKMIFFLLGIGIIFLFFFYQNEEGQRKTIQEIRKSEQKIKTVKEVKKSQRQFPLTLKYYSVKAEALDKMALTLGEIELEISTIDSVIQDRDLIDKANRNLLSQEERSHLYSLLSRRGFYFKEKVKKTLQKLGEKS